MSSEPWDVQPTALPVRGDKALFVDTSDSNNTRLTINGLEDFSRLQSAANPYSNLLIYKVGDVVEFNTTIFRNTTAVTVAEEFDPAKWTEVNGAPSVVHVRNIADLPDALTASFTSVADNGSGDTRFVFTVPHGYTDNQTVQVLNSTVSAYDGFHVIKVIDTTNFDVVGLTFTATATGDNIRTLRESTVYQLEIPYSTALGFKQISGSIPPTLSGQNTIRSSNTLVNILTLTADVPLFSADILGSLVIEDLFIQVTNPFAPFGTLFALDGVSFANNHFVQITNSTFNGIQNLGSLKNLFLVINEETSLFLYETGLTLENVPIQAGGVAQGPFPGAPTPPTFITIKNLTPLGTTSIFSGIQNFVFSPGPTFFDIDPATPTSNRVNLLDSGPITPGQYFKNGTELRGAITAFVDSVANPGVDTTATSTAHGLLVGDTVDLTNSINYNSTFVVTTVPSVNEFDFGRVFVTNPGETGDFTEINVISAFAASALGGSITAYADSATSPGVLTTATATGHSLVDGFSVTITGAPNYNGTHVISNVTTNNYDIPVVFVGDDGSSSWSVFSATTVTTVQPHGKSTGDSLLIDETIDYDGGFVIATASGSTFTINTTFVATETGVWRDGSLTQNDLAVVLRDVQGEINSLTKASVGVIDNAVSFDPTSSFTDLDLGTLAQELSDNQGWRLLDTTTGEVEYRGIEPFSGSLTAPLTVSSSGGSLVFRFRALKNSGLMVDQLEAAVSIGSDTSNVTISIPITAVTGDKIKLQSLRESGATSITIRFMSFVIQ